jgi:hypothetical protein
LLNFFYHLSRMRNLGINACSCAEKYYYFVSLKGFHNPTL